MNDSPSSSAASALGESCKVWGKAIEGTWGTAPVDQRSRRFALYLQVFEQARDPFAPGARPQSMLEQLLAEIKWKTSPKDETRNFQPGMSKHKKKKL